MNFCANFLFVCLKTYKIEASIMIIMCCMYVNIYVLCICCINRIINKKVKYIIKVAHLDYVVVVVVLCVILRFLYIYVQYWLTVVNL